HEARRLAYESTMAAAGLEPELVVFPKGTRRGAREAFLAHAAERRRLPDGLFCCNDVTALGVYRALRDLGVRIPEDVALVGCDGTDETQYVDRPISTIVMPVAQMCEQGIGFLQRRIDQPDLPLQGAELTASLCIRESSRRQVGDS
ncbi:MAG TPA: substrate-binding domain-containing protein, partial [Armatimonadota bacterium]|nr:substrate-binding domain-containing protein [Armatimonadota bacterium]